MRIATGIIGLMLGLMVMLQSCVATFGGDLMMDATTADAGAVGVIAGIFLILGGAFAFQLPGAAIIIFLLAALSAFVVDAGLFEDLAIWGWAAVLLAFMAWLARREARRAAADKA